ncbi:NAD-dependent epimerase/dehydratase family protein [Tenacibaculum finnmarkense]|uniref:NAD-dependent epimerase/dehydratase family protein n=1 Tax=Tenacibaculum finnmarkense TaxID=2781243 RepID=UPI001EFB62F4|nr:SDR family oxidoreductase [Tenacibaculum finnmarkense]MCG8206323.1 NAD-dependent epimerase/dehydratase family protein [Tenacibaculum finnmarkense genomovar finnmarkense]MCG8722367.1 NAD-dependent epimerase/dehydratase family protein [Tenacibaculum finnmarkense]MCG8740720.1 NAD-dependent epimerase/dehydratase family protein [Tenacibaculum finnmarkense]MCG8764036.1 NAD-dependent epimerase/dehydratase family protein [Tenacibaculum finnmarkense]MCG8776986.1 NAD-dependent epimerase/dehydratase f
MILVTGGTGLVGAHLLYHLTQKENKVRAIYRTDEKREHVKKIFSFYTDDVADSFAKIQWIQADITETPSLESVFKDITQVYHCAALVSFNPKDYQKMRQVNIEGTANIVNFSIENKVKKFCFVSSIAAVGDAINQKIIDEENEWSDSDTHSGYAITKYGAEMEVWRGSQEGLEVVIVNPGVILGSGFWQEGSGKLFTQINNGFNFYTQGITGFVGVQDVVKAMLLLMKSDNKNIKNERFILVSENKSFKEILDTIADNLHKKRPAIKVSKILSALAWRVSFLVSLLTKKKPLLTKNTARASHNISYYSSSKIEKALAFKFELINSQIAKISKTF